MNLTVFMLFAILVTVTKEHKGDDEDESKESTENSAGKHGFI